MGENKTVLVLNSNNIQKNPHCCHGPTILFTKHSGNSQKISQFYACSAYRDSKLCSSFQNNKFIKTNNTHDEPLISALSFQTRRNFVSNIEKLNPDERAYCYDCNELFYKSNSFPHNNHNVITPISNDFLNNPTKLLNPLDVNKKEAQFFFTYETLNFLESMLSDLQISNILCVGAPRLHEYLKHSKLTKFQTHLMDIDKRFIEFYNDYEFSWYNMFNHFFFEGSTAKKNYMEFLKIKEKDKLCLVVDPPFGCRTELLALSIQKIKQEFQAINKSKAILAVFWIFPYYMETYITNVLPEFNMIDYKVNYTNHNTFHNNEKGRSLGSPIRIFTNLSLDVIKLPASEGYKFCTPCNKWVAKENEHCYSCRLCPSKNGDTYIHCKKCKLCVKPTYTHCDSCRRCIQKTNKHNCKLYQTYITCTICRKKGHIETNCSNWIINKKNQMESKQSCLICNKTTHSEKRCTNRKKILNETYFLGNYYNLFTKYFE